MTVEEVFLAALDIADPDARALYIETVCAGHADLRREVEELLAAHSRSGQFLDVPAAQQVQFEAGDKGTQTPADPAPVATPVADRDEQIGTVLGGKYKLIETIGEGGMGTVFMAQQLAPLVRAVAIKVVKEGMDSKAVLARFDVERQALAMMDHPNIAKVLDVGTTPSGRPYFVMELVKGVQITRFCDERRLDLMQRLELFVPVCQAIQHAHQKGIIHRDIKPSNVLVALYDERPVPKVIDFGVAKAVAGPALTDKTLMTGFGVVVGTPEYMSPEQASLNNLDVDTRSDVYSLGVLLYELLTGTTPVDRKSLVRAGVLEVLRIVREMEATKPSAKLSTLDNLPSVAANRGMEPANLSKLMQGELDWVVLKAIEKDRTRRYETANALSRDIQRHLADEFVEARPPSRGYRLKKFVRRHRGPVIAVGLVLLAVMVGLVGTVWGLVLAQANEQRALLAAEAEKSANENEKTQRAAAEKARDRTRSVLDAMVSEVTGDSLATQKEISEEQKKFLQGVLGYYREFAGEGDDNVLARERHMRAAYQVGTIEYRLGRKEESVVAFRIAQTGYTALVAEFPTASQYRQLLARTHNSLALVLAQLGQRDPAAEQSRLGLLIQEKLVTEIPSNIEYRSDLALSYNTLGGLLAERGQNTDAAEQYRKSLTIREALVTEFPNVPVYREDLAQSHSNLGIVLKNSKLPQAAEEQYRKGLAIQQKLPADVARYRQSLALSHNNLGGLLNETERGAAAAIELRQGLVIQEKLVADFPTVPAYRQDLARSHFNLGVVLKGLGQAPAATEQYRKGLAIHEKLVADFPAIPAYRTELAQSHYNLANHLFRTGQAAESEEQHRKGLAIREALATEFPGVFSYRRELARSHNNFGNRLADRGLVAESQAQYRKALAIDEKLVAEHPTVVVYQVELGGSYCNVGNASLVGGKPADSLKWYKRALDRLRPIYESDPRTENAKLFLRNSYLGSAQAHDQTQQYANAVKDWEQALALSTAAEKLGFRALRVTSLINAGQVSVAIAEVADLTKSQKWSADRWYDFACVYARASRKEPEKKTEHADRAVDLLRKAIAAGYKNAAHMKKDTDLDPLRDRADFRKLLADLETSPNKPLEKK